jgi:hypothetical protein
MAAIADPGALYGLYNRRDRHHRALRAAIIHEPGAILISAAVLSEVDYLIGAILGVNAQRDLLDDILGCAFTLGPFTLVNLRRSRELIDQYRTPRSRSGRCGSHCDSRTHWNPANPDR